MQQYWLSEPGQQTKGPFSLSHLEELAKNNSVSPRAKVCLVGNSDWVDLKRITNTASKPGLIQPKTPQVSGGKGSYIAPPALPQTTGANNAPAISSPPQIPNQTLTNPNISSRTVPIIAIFGLMFGLFLLLLSGSMIFLFGLKNETPSPNEKKESLAKVVKGEEVKKATPANKEKVATASLIQRQKVWELKDEVLKKTVTLLSSNEANTALADLGTFAKEPAEEKIRLFLYERRGQGLLKKAAELLKELPPDALEEFKKIIPEDQSPENMVLDWLTHESLRDFGYLLKIWQEQG
ncbi:MAG: GYF domain-containing protein, partial [Planctomycetota bacterium]